MPHKAISKRATTFRGDIARLMAGTAFAQAIGVLAAPVLTRLYSPEVFGQSAYFLSITSIAALFSCLRYEMSIVLPEDDRAAANQLALSVIISIIVSLMSVPAILFAQTYVINIENVRYLSPYLWIIPITIFLTGLQNAMTYWTTRLKQYSQLSISRVAHAITNQSASIGLALLGRCTVSSLLFAQLGGQLFAALTLSVLMGKQNISYITKNVKWGMMASGLRLYRDFPLFGLWGAFINAVSWQLPVLMLGMLFSSSVVGHYAFGFRLFQIPMRLVGSSVGQVLYQRGAAVPDRSMLADVVQGLMSKMLIFSLLPSVILMSIGEELFGFVFGSKWSEAGLYAQILAPWALVWFISSPFSGLFAIVGKQKYELFVHLTIFVMRFGAVLLGGVAQDARLTMVLLSGGGVVAYGLLLGLVVKFSGARLCKVLFRDIRLLNFTVVLYFPVYALKYVVPTSGQVLAMVGVSCVLLYLLICRKLLFGAAADYPVS